MFALQSRCPSPSVALLIAGLLAACAGSESTAPRPTLAASGNGPNGKNATVRVSPETATLDALHTLLQLTANVEVTWTSLTPDVATVDPAGIVEAVGPGIGLIQALGGRKADTAQVLVRQIQTSLQVTPHLLEVDIGGTGTLTAVAADANGYAIPNVPVIWTSDATAVATVQDGLVTGVDSGTTTVRAAANGFSDAAEVRVPIPANPYP
jgi:uncharacterized protein YjdB